MKMVPFLMMVLASQVALAESGTPAPDKFAERKAKAVEMIDKRVTGLQELKTCVGAAADQAAMKACREKHRETMTGLKIEMEEMRHEKRMEKLRNKAGN